MNQFLIQASILLTSSDEGDGSIWLLASGPVCAVAVYGMIYRYYRNTDKSHNYEKETRIVSQPAEFFDQLIDKVTGTSRAWIANKNSSDYRKRVQRVDPTQ